MNTAINFLTSCITTVYTYVLSKILLILILFIFLKLFLGVVCMLDLAHAHFGMPILGHEGISHALPFLVKLEVHMCTTTLN